MTQKRPRLLGPLGWRLFAAFTLVAVGAVVLLATVATLSVEHQTTALADRQIAQTERAIVRALQTAYARAGSWDTVDLGPVQALAQEAGIPVLIVDVSGSPVATLTPHEQDSSGDHPSTVTATTTATRPGQGPGTSRSRTPTAAKTATGQRSSHAPTGTGPRIGRSGAEEPGEDHGGNASGAGQGNGRGLPAAAPAGLVSVAATPSPRPPAAGRTTLPIIVRGTQVGSVTFGEPVSSSTDTGQARAQILDAVWIGGALAIVLAALAALVVSRRVSRPVVALVAATDALERGVPDSTSRLRGGPGEIGQLSRAFDRMARTLQREDQLRRALVADVAHELRTPVTTLLGLTEELLDGLSDPTPERFASLHDEVLRLRRLVDDLAVLSAAQAATLTLQQRPVDLLATAADVVELLAPQFADAEVTVDVVGEPVVFSGDDTRLRQVLTNLLTNAAKFTPAGGHVLVEVSTGDAHAMVTVTDTGPGIPADELAHVFDRFWRGRGAAGRAGSGIGLAVVAELTAAHGGTVSAESPPGGGARFTVRLPLG